MDQVARLLVFAGVFIALAGLILWGMSRLGFGRLPGDIVIDHATFKLVFPIRHVASAQPRAHRRPERRRTALALTLAPTRAHTGADDPLAP